MQDPDDLDSYLDGYSARFDATATLPMDDPQRAAPITMAPELEELDGYLDNFGAREAGITLGDLGFRSLPAEEALAMLELAEKPREAGEAVVPGWDALPLVGYGFTLKDQAQALQAQARVMKGKATAEDERLYLGYLVDAARESTTGAGVLDVAWTILTTGAEVGMGGGAVSLAKAGGKKALKAAGQQLMSEALEKAAAKATERTIGKIALQAAPALVAATGLQEVVSSLYQGEGLTGGGAWTLQSVQQLLGREMTEAEAQEIIDAKNAVLPVLLEQAGGLMDGLIRQSIEMGAEGAGPLLGKLPLVSQIDLVTGMLFSKLGGTVGAGGWSKAALEIAQQQGVGSEIAEEFLSAITTAAMMGDKSIAEAALEVAEQTPEFAGALLLMRGGVAGAQRVGTMLPGRAAKPGEAATGAVEYVFQDGQWTKGGDVVMEAEVLEEIPASVREGAVDGTVYGVGAPEASAPEGGDRDEAAPVETGAAPVAETITPEVQAADVEAFSREARAPFRVVEGELRSEEVAAQQFMRRFGVEVTVAEADEGADLESLPAAFYPGEGRAVVLRGQPQLTAVAVHEGLHTYLAQQPAERRADLGNALREIDPVFMGRVEEFVKAQPIYQNLAPEVLAEEMATNAATLLGGLTSYLTTPQGKADFALAYGKQPGPIRRALGALYDWVQGMIPLLPQRRRALARARLRVARNEENPALVAQRVLEALREIRPVKAEAAPATDVSGVVTRGATTGVAPAAEATETLPPRPPKTPADRRANRAARKARAAERAKTLAAEAEAAKTAAERRSLRASKRRKPEVVTDEADVSPDEAAFGLGPDQGMRFAAAYHGSPHDFDRFDMSKIGTGGGAQAFGHGLYFAGKREVAEHYKRALAGRVLRVGDRDLYPDLGTSRAEVSRQTNAETMAANAIDDALDAQSSSPAQYAANQIRQNMRFAEDSPQHAADLNAALEIIADWQESGAEHRRAGKLYQVDLKPAEDEYLLWDEPLSKQSEKVRRALGSLGRGSDPRHGRDLYRSLVVELESDIAASYALKRVGIRGIKYLDGTSRGKGEGAYNYVLFDDADVTIEGKFAPRPPADALVASFLDDAEILDLSSKALRAVSDEFLAVERWQKAAEALGASAGANPISAVRRFFGKVAVKGEPIKDFAQRIGDHLRRSKIALADAGLYAEARHTREAREDFLLKHEERKRLAEERKALVKAAKDVPRDAQFERDLRALEKRIADLSFVPIVIPDGHAADHYFHEVADVTGMKTSEAEAKLAAFEAQPGYKRLGRMIDALNRHTLRQQRDYQLITQAQFESRRQQFQHYVPLRTAEVDRPERPRGSGFNVRGPETMRRKGRRSLASNPLVMSLAQAMKAVERGEKNAVGHELRDFLIENRGVIDSSERDDVAINDEGKPALDSDEFYLKVDGRDVAIKIENPDVARAMKRLGLVQIPKALRLYSTLFGYWKLAATSLSPEFLLTNFARDVETALVNVSSVARDLDIRGLRRDMLRGVPSAGRTAWQAARGKPVTTGLGDFFEEYRQAGGQIGSFGSASFEAIEQSMESTLGTTPIAKARRALAPMWSVIEDANGAVEQANRFSLFVALRQRGVSVNDAALAARRITVDFSQKGEAGTLLSLAYAFFSAAVGGTRRLAETMNSPVGRRIAGGLVGLGFAQTLANYYSSDDDEDGRKFYEKISEGEKERSAIFMVPGFDEPLKVPLGYGLNVFHAAGRIMAETFLGMHSEGEAAQLMLLTALNGFAPIGAAPSLAQFVSPTVTDPAVQLIENQNFMGNPITPYESKFGAESPRYQKSFRATSPLAIDMARILNDMTGGDSIKPGALNLSGDEIEHVYEFVGAGVARFISRAFAASRAVVAGESLSEVAQVAPFLRVVYGSRTEFADSDLFYESMDAIEYENRYLKEAVEAGDRERVAELRERFRPTLALERAGKRVKDQTKALRDAAYTGGKVTDPEKLREANRLVQAWNRRYIEALSAK